MNKYKYWWDHSLSVPIILYLLLGNAMEIHSQSCHYYFLANLCSWAHSPLITHIKIRVYTDNNVLLPSGILLVLHIYAMSNKSELSSQLLEWIVTALKVHMISAFHVPSYDEKGQHHQCGHTPENKRGII